MPVGPHAVIAKPAAILGLVNVISQITAEDYAGGGALTLADRVAALTWALPNSMGKHTDAAFTAGKQVVYQPGGGTNGFIRTTASPVSGLSSYGISITLKMAATGGVIWDSRNAGNSQPLAAWFGNPNPYYMDAGTALNTGAAGTAVAHHMYYEANGASSKIYMDGALYASGNIGANVPTTTFTFIGVFNSGGFNAGHVFCEAKMMTGTQSAAAVAAESAAQHTKWGF